MIILALGSTIFAKKKLEYSYRFSNKFKETIKIVVNCEKLGLIGNERFDFDL